MTPEKKLLRLFFYAHGIVGGSCSLRVEYGESDLSVPIGVTVVKDGLDCWYASREELLFEYVTRGFKEGPIPG